MKIVLWSDETTMEGLLKAWEFDKEALRMSYLARPSGAAYGLSYWDRVMSEVERAGWLDRAMMTRRSTRTLEPSLCADASSWRRSSATTKVALAGKITTPPWYMPQHCALHDGLDDGTTYGSIHREGS